MNYETPLCIAVTFNNAETVQALLNTGTDVNATDNRGSTPIHHATQNKHIDAIKILLNANANPNIRNKNGDTPSD